jgi:hypothetical protein
MNKTISSNIVVCTPIDYTSSSNLFTTSTYSTNPFTINNSNPTINMTLDTYNQLIKKNINKNGNTLSKKLRDTGFKGIHVHFDKTRENISFRPTLKIERKEQLSYQNFDFDYFGLFIAIRFKDDYIIKQNLPSSLLLIKDSNIKYQIEVALKNRDMYSLKMLFSTITGKKEFPFEEIIRDIQSDKKD